MALFKLYLKFKSYEIFGDLMYGWSIQCELKKQIHLLDATKIQII